MLVFPNFPHPSLLDLTISLKHFLPRLHPASAPSDLCELHSDRLSSLPQMPYDATFLSGHISQFSSSPIPTMCSPWVRQGAPVSPRGKLGEAVTHWGETQIGVKYHHQVSLCPPSGHAMVSAKIGVSPPVDLPSLKRNITLTTRRGSPDRGGGSHGQVHG